MDKKFTLEEVATFYAVENLCSCCDVCKDCKELCFRIEDERDYVLNSFLKRGYKRMTEKK